MSGGSLNHPKLELRLQPNGSIVGPVQLPDSTIEWRPVFRRPSVADQQPVDGVLLKEEAEGRSSSRRASHNMV